MDSERYFIFLFPEDLRLLELLNLAIFVLNPSEKWPAHVTVAGPYSTKRGLPKDRNIDATVSALGVGSFRSERQHTIWLRVGAAEISHLWHKPDISGTIIPHMTIYDGNDRELSDLLYEELDKLRLFFFFHVSKIHVVSAIKGQYRSDLINQINPLSLPETARHSIAQLKNLGRNERVHVAVSALRRAKYYLSLTPL